MSGLAITKNAQQENIQRAFLQECSLKRLSAIVGQENTSRFLSDFIILAEQNPKANMANLSKCCIEIASMRLPILQQAGQAYVVPRGGNYNVEIGYKGWLVLAKRAGIVVRAYPIYEGDEYTYEVDGFSQVFKFSPSQSNINAEKTAEFVDNNLLFIAVVTKDLTTGIETCDLLEYALLKRLRSKSASKDSPAYRDWLLEMYKAKAIKYVLKKMPIDTLDSSIFRAFAEDDKSDIGYSEPQTREKPKANNGLGSAFLQANPQGNQSGELFDPNTGEVIANNETTLPIIDVESM